MTRLHKLKFASGHVSYLGIIGHTSVLHGLFKQCACNDIVFFGHIVADYYIILYGIQCYGQVSGQCPGGGSPDNEICVVLDVAELAEIVRHAELDVHGGTFICLVLYLSLCKRSFVVRAPIYRLESFINVALFEHLAEHPDLSRLKAGRHSHIRVFPVSRDAETDKLLALTVNEFLCKVMAGIAELGNGHFFAIQLVLLYDSALYRHTVVVPAGNIRNIVAAHGLGLVNKILKYFVERGAHVYVAVGKRGAVVKQELRPAFGALQHFMIQVRLLPVFQCFRLSLRQIRTH